MKNMTLEQIAAYCGGVYSGKKETGSVEVAGIAIDSRKIEKDWLFIATKGEKVDGHSFVRQVMEAGALGVVVEKEPEYKDIPYILVSDSFRAIRDIAAFYRAQLSVKVVGITGSVGKTSTKEMIAGVLEQKYKVWKTAGNFNNEVGLPLTVFGIRDTHEVAVLEMGISDFGEMNRLGEIAKPDICVITNIGECHLENLKDREGVLRAKTEVFQHMNPDGVAVLNGGDDMLRTLDLVNGNKPVFFGKSGENQVYSSGIKSHGFLGSSCTIHTPQGSFEAEIPLPGEHMITNALAATAVGLTLGLTLEEIATGIRRAESVGGRSHIIQTEQYTLIDDCYNANPVSMKAALDLLQSGEGRKVAVLGDMFELGNETREFHRGTGVYAANTDTDVIVCVGELAKELWQGVREETERNGREKKLFYFAKKEDFLEEWQNILLPGDTVLIKASHGMHFAAMVDKMAGRQ